MKYFFTLILILITANCFSQTTTYAITISSSALTLPKIERFYSLVPEDSMKNIHNTLKNKSHLDLIKKSLLKNQYFYVDDTTSKKVDCIITYSYGISNPILVKEKYYKATYSSGTNLSNNVNVNVNSNNSSSVAATSIKPITFDPVNIPVASGYVPIENESTNFKRTLTLKCLSVDGIKREEIWIIEATSSGYSDNIHQVLPVMIFSVTDYIGLNLRMPKNISVREKSSNLKRFLE